MISSDGAADFAALSATLSSRDAAVTGRRIVDAVRGLVPDADLCALHGWQARTVEPEVWDAVLFTTELDLLDIRWHELDSVVDKFFLVENNGASSDFARSRGRA